MSNRPDPGEAATAGPLAVTVVRSREEFAALEAGWRSILDRASLSSPFATWEWVEAWLATIGRRTELFIVVVREGSAVTGIAPLCKAPGGSATFIGAPQNDYGGVLVPAGRDDVLGAIARTIRDNIRELGPVVFDEMPDDTSQWRELARALREAGCRIRVDLAGTCMLMPLSDGDAARKVYYKKNIKNYINWFERQGELTFAFCEDPDDALRALEDLFEQHVERWDDTPFPSAFHDPEVREFYRRFLRSLHASGHARICSLDLDGEHLAMYLYLRYERRVYMYKPTFNIRHRDHSPGQVILRYILDDALDGDAKPDALDYGRGDEGYKTRFATEPRSSWRVTVYRSWWGKLLADQRYNLRRSWIVRKLLEWDVLRTRQ